jgi:hypothetical protein
MEKKLDVLVLLQMSVEERAKDKKITDLFYITLI